MPAANCRHHRVLDRIGECVLCQRQFLRALNVYSFPCGQIEGLGQLSLHNSRPLQLQILSLTGVTSSRPRQESAFTYNGKTLARERKTRFGKVRHHVAGPTINIDLQEDQMHHPLQRWTRFAALALAMLFALPHILSAQTTTTGAINGTVEDPSGASVGGAKIAVLSEGTNAEQTITADGEGFFTVGQLQPGSYTVTITAAGFSDYKATAVQVLVGNTTTLSPKLAVSSSGTTVEVSGAAPMINTENPDFSTTLSEQTIDNLPINGRRWSDLTLLTPGVVADSNGFGLLSVRGISPLLNNVQIDGADDNQAYFSEERGRTREGYSTPMVAVQEFQVNTGVYSAEYGRATGGVINSVTKSGTNQLHGELYFYDRDNDWGAKNPFTKLTTFDAASGTTSTIQYKPKDWRKQWGFGVGGPIIKDKLFWFYTYDQFQRNFPGTAVPSNPGAFFQAPDAAIPAPYSCATIISSAGKTQPSNPVDAQACVLQARLKLATYTDAVNLYNTDLGAITTVLGSVNRTGNQTINMPKIDWQVNEKKPRQLHLQPSRLALARRRADPGDEQLQYRRLRK